MSSEFDDVPRSPSAELLPTALGPPPRRGLRLSHLMILVVVVAFVCWIIVVSRVWLLGGFVILLLVGITVLAVAVAVLVSKMGGTERQALLSVFQIAAERSLPLGPAAMAIAEEFGVFFRGRVRLFAAMLQQGMPLPAALDRVPGLTNRDARFLVKLGAVFGNLPAALRSAVGLRDFRDGAWGSLALRFSYLGWAFLWLQLLGGFIIYFIAPKYEAIMKDFGIPLPELTRYTILVGHFFVNYAVIFLPVFLLELLANFLAMFGLLTVFQWDVPYLDMLFRRRHAALVLRGVSIGVESKAPMPTLFEAMSRAYPWSWVRGRLRAASGMVKQGEPWIDALRRVGIVRAADAAVLAAAERAGNLEWALRETADAVERRLGYRMQLALQALFPLILIALGLVIGLFAVAYFLPLIEIITRLAG